MRKPGILLVLLGVTTAAALMLRAAEKTADPAEDSPSDRMALRAYYTAPPVIPHLVTSGNNQECKVCHAQVLKIGGRTSIPTPHLQFDNCQQCHVGTQQFNQDLALELPASNWIGLVEPREGSRAHELAPPTIPHRLFLREQCTSCHNREHPNPALRIDHEERTNCQQCHVAERDGEF